MGRTGESALNVNATNLTCVLGANFRYQICSHFTAFVTHDQPGILVVYRPLLARLLNHPSVSKNSRVGFFATYLVVEERVPDIFGDFGHGQNVTLALLVSTNVDAIAERGAFISDQPESTWRELAWLWTELIAATYLNNVSHRSCWLSSCSASSLSSEHSLSSRAMMESSLSFISGDRCSVFSCQPVQ